MKGEILAELRKDSEMTQKELGEVLSVSATTISSYERNKTTPSDDIKIEIANIFQVSLDYLFGVTKKRIELDWRNVLVLPENYTDEVREEMLDYAELRSKKYKEKSRG